MNAVPGDGRYLGIDFSGDFRKWATRCRRSNVWIAEAEAGGGRLRLRDVQPVQDLPGAGSPFERLVERLRRGDFRAAALDAPFSVAAAPVDGAPHDALLARVDALSLLESRPFPAGASLVEALAGTPLPLTPPKPLRTTDRVWTARGVNVRSGLWNGARPGAPLASACMKLLARTGAPLWPWCGAGVDGLLCEGFPAAQLRQWGLPHQRYAGAAGAALRRRIVAVLQTRIDIAATAVEQLVESPDALDATLCLFPAAAAFSGGAAGPDDLAPWRCEGWISVAP